MTVGLELEGFDIVCASGGRAALEAVKAVKPAAMLLDLTMPDLDGLDVLERLRATGDDLPVCVGSARERVSDRVRGLEAGADDYVVKPFALEEVSARLHALLRRRPPAATERLAVGDVQLDPVGYPASPWTPPSSTPPRAPPGAAAATSASRAASSSCSSCSCATPARSSTAAACTRRSGATRSTPARTSPTCSSATCAASWRRAASRA